VTVSKQTPVRNVSKPPTKESRFDKRCVQAALSRRAIPAALRCEPTPLAIRGEEILRSQTETDAKREISESKPSAPEQTLTKKYDWESLGLFNSKKSWADQFDIGKWGDFMDEDEMRSEDMKVEGWDE
jgi:hypothetical protein